MEGSSPGGAGGLVSLTEGRMLLEGGGRNLGEGRKEAGDSMPRWENRKGRKQTRLGTSWELLGSEHQVQKQKGDFR